MVGSEKEETCFSNQIRFVAQKLESLDKINLGYTDSIQNIFRINGDVEVYAEGELPIDGLVIEDLRKYE